MTVTDSWRAQAACRGLDPNLFVPELPRMTCGKADREEFVRQVTKACEVCESCPVRAECWWYGYENRLQGIWGGELFDRKWWGTPILDANVGQYLAIRDGRPPVPSSSLHPHQWHDGPGPRTDAMTRSELLAARITGAEEPEHRRPKTVLAKLYGPSRQIS